MDDLFHINIIGIQHFMDTETQLLAFALVAMAWIVGVVAVETLIIAEQAQAAQPAGRGCEFTPGFNASKGRCFH